MATSAAAISALIRRWGWKPIPTHNRKREGVRVTRGHLPGIVTVEADFNWARLADEIATDLADFLSERGYTVHRAQNSPRMQVSR